MIKLYGVSKTQLKMPRIPEQQMLQTARLPITVLTKKLRYIFSKRDFLADMNIKEGYKKM